MRLTTHTDYALRVMIYLALAPKRLATIREISDRYGMANERALSLQMLAVA